MARGHHDVGGLPGAGPIDKTEHELAEWEVLADAINRVLGAKRIKRTDEERRAREEMDPDEYRRISYYERWIVGIERILVEKGVLTQEAIDSKLAELENIWRNT